MITAERATSSAVKVAREPTRKTAESITELLIMLAFAKIAKGLIRGAGRVGSVIVSKLDDIASQAKRGIRRLSGGPVLPANVRRQLDEIIAGVNRRVDEFLGDHGDDFRGAGRKIVSGASTINDVFGLLSGAVVEAFEAIKDLAIQELTYIFYSFYVIAVDDSINRGMADLRDAIGEERLGSDGATDRKETQQNTVADFENTRDAFLDTMDISDVLEDVGSILIVAAAFGAVALYAISAVLSATGIGLTAAAILASGASYLAAAATYLTVGLVGLLAAGTILGVGFLYSTMDEHDTTVDYVVNYELQGGVSR